MARCDVPGSSPSDELFNYSCRVSDVDPAQDQSEGQHRFSVGDRVWVRDPSRRCDVPSSLGTVSRIVSIQNVEVDGVSRHVRDLRLALLPRSSGEHGVPVSAVDGTDGVHHDCSSQGDQSEGSCYPHAIW